MAALIRTNANILARNIRHSIRLVATSPSGKGQSKLGVVSEPGEKTDFSIEAVKKSKDWVSYGFEFRNKEVDRSVMRATLFVTVTLCIVGGTFIWAYLPDRQMLEWAQREAYLVLREREAAGLDPISPDLVDPNTIELPTDEELGDTEIII